MSGITETDKARMAEIKTEVSAMTNDERKTTLDSWAAGEGTEYQRRMGFLAQRYQRG